MKALLVLLCGLLLGGCETLSYYGHVSQGHLRVLHARQPVQQLIDDPHTDPSLRERLAASQRARDFASAQLKLPDNQSYRRYADLQRPYVVWNVFATPELSLKPIEHCFLIAGCVAYRGYYQPERAAQMAAKLKAEGNDTYVAGIEAYSTLGWFDDPLLNTLWRRTDEQVAGLIFHELAHQQVYVPHDTVFNESFASFVEQEGVRQWREAQGLPRCSPNDGRQRQFLALVLASRARLATLYASDLSDAEKRQGKAEEIARLRAEYAALRDGPWQGDARYDRWFAQPLNNAVLLPFGLYDQWVPAFAAWYQAVGDWPLFYQQVAQVATWPNLEREAYLTRWLAANRSASTSVKPTRGKPWECES